MSEYTQVNIPRLESYRRRLGLGSKELLRGSDVIEGIKEPQMAKGAIKSELTSKCPRCGDEVSL